jgi:hypothetical protein
MKRAVLLLLAFSLGVVAEEPNFVMGGGVGFNYYANPRGAIWGVFAPRVAEKTYSFTSFDATQYKTTIRTGIARAFYAKDRFSLFGIADIGAALGEGNVGAAYSGSGMCTYHIKGPWYAMGSFTMLKTTLNEPQPVGRVGILLGL